MSIWRKLRNSYYKVSGSHYKLLEGRQKVNGSWRNLGSADVPANMIVLFKAVPGSPWTVVSSPTLDDKYGKCHSAQGSAGGSHTHIHTTNTFTTGSMISPYYRDNGIYAGMMINHTHTYAHGHLAQTNHEPEWFGLCPAIGGFPIPITGFIFYDGFVDPDGWESDSALFNKFIKFKASSPGGTGGALTHQHSITLSTVANYAYVANAGLGSATQTHANHTHSVTHTHSNQSNNLSYYTLRPIHPTLETSKIPSGAIAFFIGSVVPGGWTQLSAMNDRYIKMMSFSGVTGGALTHTMNHSAMSTGSYGSSSRNPRSGSYYAKSGTSHQHYGSGVNHASGSLEPAYQQLLICKKN